MSESDLRHQLQGLEEQMRRSREEAEAQREEMKIVRREADEQSQRSDAAIRGVSEQLASILGHLGGESQAQAAPGGSTAGRSDPAGASLRENMRADASGAAASSRHQRAGDGGTVPAEVGPREGEPGEGGQDRGFGLDGESAHAPSDFGRQDSARRLAPHMKMAIPCLKNEKDWPVFRDKAGIYAKFYGFDDVLSSEVHIEVGSKTINRDQCIRELGVSSADYDRHLRAWVFFDQAFVTNTDRGRMKRVLSPSLLWQETQKWYAPSTVGRQVELRRKFDRYKFPKGKDPTVALYEIEDIAEEIAMTGTPVDYQLVYSTFVSSLPDEYEYEVRQLSEMESFDRDEIQRKLRSAFEVMQRRKKSSPQGHALFSDGGRGAGGARGRGRGRGGGRGGRGKSSSQGGRGSSTENGGGKKTAENGGKTGGETTTAEKVGASGPRCFNCHRRGHISAECKHEVCKRCGGVGHKASSCSSSPDVEDGLMTISHPEHLDVPDPGDGYIVAMSMMAHETEVEGLSFVATEVAGDEVEASSSGACGAQAFRKYIELGELLCDSLDDAPGSTLLQFAISSTETVTAQRTSYTVIGGDAFTDGNERKVWKGSVVDPAPSNNGGSPRFISMTWGSPCDVENFLLKMISFNADGTTSKTTSVPCEAGSSTQICMMQFDIDLPSNDEPLASSGGNTLGNISDVTRHLAEDRLTSKTHTRRLHAEETKRSSRRLQSTTQIDVMVVYSEEAMDKALGDPSASQMEALIADEFSTTTAAATNSEIDLQFNLVFSRRLFFKQSEQVWDPTRIVLQLDALPNNERVKDVRNTYLADLVVLVGDFGGSCGIGFLNQNTRVADEQYGFSAVDIECLNGRTLSHEMGHNLGCLHQIGLSDGVPLVNDYAHGWQNCDVSDQRFCMVTIMAYWTGGPYFPAVLNHFSNPHVSYRGLPTGTPTANNAQVIRDNMDAVSKFRVACRSDEACEGNGVCIDGVCGFDRCDSSLGNLSLGPRGACDTSLNNAECGYDGGDCCQCDCKGSPDFTCGMSGYNCLNPYSECFGACEVDDDCDAGSGEICCPGKKKCEVPLEGTDPAVCGCDPEKDDCPMGTICCEEKLVCEVPEEGSNPAACGDPHMTGFLGQKFDFTGEDGGHYALIKDGAAMHMNMRVTSPVPEVPVITYITGLSISATDSEGKAHSIIIDVKDPHTTESSCPPGTHPCLADGSLRVILDGVDTLFAPDSVTLGKDLSVSAVNIPGECRSFGFEHYWERKKLEYGGSTRRLSEEESMGEWILGDPTATNMEECMVYVANAQLQPGGLFSHQSEHASFKIVTPKAIVRLSHGRLHQVAMRDPTDHFDLPEHVTWQMNIGLEKNRLSHTATGILGETFVPTLNADGTPIMSGMESIRGSQEDYRVKGSLGSIFAQDST